MKKFLKTFIFAFAIIFVVLLSNVIVKADTGPKPYVSIKIIGDTQGYYMTLISKSNQCGPYSNNSEYQENIDNIDLKFAEYEDSDGYYYLYYYSDISNNVYGWNYYPPSHFKILIYDSITSLDCFAKYARKVIRRFPTLLVSNEPKIFSALAKYSFSNSSLAFL